MLLRIRIYNYRKELCLFCAVIASLLGLSSTLAAAPRTINFGEQDDSSTRAKAYAVIGEIAKPATYQLKQKEVTLKQLIEHAGGATPEAGKKIRVLRGGKSILVLLRSGQDQFKLSAGDVVILDREWRTSARTVSFDNLKKTSSKPGSPMVVNRANLRPNRTRPSHGEIVLLGLKSQPVVLPLWGEQLTVDTLLRRYMKQPREVVTGTRIVVGQKNKTDSHLLTAGMILSIPNALVNRDTIPKLPAPIPVGKETQQDKSDKPEEATTSSVSPVESTPLAHMTENPISRSLQHSLPMVAPVTNVTSAIKPTVIAYSEIITPQTEQTVEPELEEQNVSLPTLPTQVDSQPKSETLFVPQEIVNETPTNELLSVEPQPAGQTDPVSPLNSFTTDFFSTTTMAGNKNVEEAQTTSQQESGQEFLPPVEQNDFANLLEEKIGESFHAAQAGEVVPNPVELKKTEGPTMIGFIAGAIVLIGVMTVIISALRNQLSHPEQYFEQQEPLLEQTANKSVENRSITEKDLPPSPPVTAAAPTNSTPLSSDPLTRAKKQKEDGLKALLENQIPILEERVLMPRELKFFGKPNLYYEFRLDSSHEIKKPHLASKMGKLKQKQELENESEIKQPAGGPKFSAATDKKRKQSVPVFWEAETGLFVSSNDLYREISSGNE